VKDGNLYVANLGDCRAVLSRDGAATALTSDHTAARGDERARIESSVS
jgi:protein phosphatase 1L